MIFSYLSKFYFLLVSELNTFVFAFLAYCLGIFRLGKHIELKQSDLKLLGLKS